MKKWYWFVLIVITYLVFFIAYTPASYITGYIQESSRNQVFFSGVAGTVFKGQAASVMSQGIQVSNAKWQLSPLSLLLLQADLDITAGNIKNTEQIYIKGNITSSLLNTKSFSLKDAQVFVPTKTLLSQLRLPVFVTASGRFRVDVEQFSFDQGCQQLQGNGNWLNAAVNVNQKQVSFGTFDARLSCESSAFAIQIAPSNDLRLDAKLTVDMAGKYNVQGQFNIPSTMPNEIKQAAPYFGKEISQGVYTINF